MAYPQLRYIGLTGWDTVVPGEQRCSFCGTIAKNTSLMVSGPSRAPAEVYICDYCIRVAMDIILNVGLDAVDEDFETMGGTRALGSNRTAPSSTAG